MWALLRNGVLIGMRYRVVHALVVAGILIILSALLASGFSGRQPVTVGLDVGLSGLRFVLLLIALVWVQLLLAQDIERKSIYFMLAYPYSRGQFLLMRFAVLALLAAGATLVLGAGLWATMKLCASLYSQISPPALGGAYWLVLLGIWLDLLVVLAFAVLLSCVSTTPFLPLIVGLLFALAARGLGPTLDYLRSEAMSGTLQAGWLGPLLEYTYLWLCDLSRLDWRPLALYGLPVDFSMIATSIAMVAGYAGALLSVAVLAFQRRDFV